MSAEEKTFKYQFMTKQDKEILTDEEKSAAETDIILIKTGAGESAVYSVYEKSSDGIWSGSILTDLTEQEKEILDKLKLIAYQPKFQAHVSSPLGQILKTGHISSEPSHSSPPPLSEKSKEEDKKEDKKGDIIQTLRKKAIQKRAGGLFSADKTILSVPTLIELRKHDDFNAYFFLAVLALGKRPNFIATKEDGEYSFPRCRVSAYYLAKLAEKAIVTSNFSSDGQAAAKRQVEALLNEIGKAPDPLTPCDYSVVKELSEFNPKLVFQEVRTPQQVDANKIRESVKDPYGVMQEKKEKEERILPELPLRDIDSPRDTESPTPSPSSVKYEEKRVDLEQRMGVEVKLRDSDIDCIILANPKALPVSSSASEEAGKLTFKERQALIAAKLPKPKAPAELEAERKAAAEEKEKRRVAEEKDAPPLEIKPIVPAPQGKDGAPPPPPPMPTMEGLNAAGRAQARRDQGIEQPPKLEGKKAPPKTTGGNENPMIIDELQAKLAARVARAAKEAKEEKQLASGSSMAFLPSPRKMANGEAPKGESPRFK